MCYDKVGWFGTIFRNLNFGWQQILKWCQSEKLGWTLIGTTTPSQNRPRSNDKEGILHTSLEVKPH